MAVSFRLLPLLAALFAASCSTPLWLAPSQQGAVPAPNVAATARLGFSLPHETTRSLSVFQATVEPENLVQAIDHYSLTLSSASGPQTVNKTISKAVASNVAIEGLVAAADWSLEVKAWADAGEGSQIGRFFANTGLSTTAGTLTNLGDLTVAPVPGAGTSSFRLEIADLPPSLTVGPQDFDLSVLAADGTATDASAGDKATLTLSKVQNLVVVQSSGLPTGTYRLVVNLKDALGQPAFSPQFVINLFPNLTSTKTLSAASWNQPTVTGTITPATPVAGLNALVLAWTTDSPTLFSGYEWVWHPGAEGDDLPTAADFDPSMVSPTARSGFLSPAGGSVPLSRPQWTLSTGDFAADLAVSTGWTLYVRGVAPGSMTGWIATYVNLQLLEFPFKIGSFTVYSSDTAGTHTLIRTTADPTTIGVQPTSVPVLSAVSFSATNEGDALTVTPSAPLYVAPGDFLSLVTPSGQYRPFGIMGRPSGPGQTANLHAYQAIKAGSSGYAAFDQAELAVLGDSRSSDWTVDPKVDNGSGGFTPRGRVFATPSNILKIYGNLQVTGYQFAQRTGNPLTLDGQVLGFLDKVDPNAGGSPGAILNTSALNTSADIRHIVVRVQYTMGDGTNVYGPWSNTAADTFWGRLAPDLVVNETNRSLNTGDPSGWDLSLTGTWTDAQESAPGTAPIEYRTKQVGDYDWGAWSNVLTTWTPNGTSYDWELTVNFATGAQGDIQFRVSSADDPVTEYAALDFAGASPPLANLMANASLIANAGKITYLAADRQNNGWFAQGFTGGNVFLSRWFSGGGHDNAWATTGSIINSGLGAYFPQGIGFVQTAGAGYRLWLNGFFNNGVGNVQYRSYTSTGALDNAGITKTVDHGLGRPVIDSAGNIVYLGWYNNGGPNKLWVDKMDSTGTATAFHWEVPNTIGQARDDSPPDGRLLQTLAIDGSNKVLLAGGKRVMRIGTDALTDTSFASASSGVFTIDLSDTGTDTDILAMKVESVTGKIYLLVDSTWQNTTDSEYYWQDVATIVRLNNDGTLDITWGGTEGYRNRPGTIVLPTLYSGAKAIDLDASGKVVVVGRTTTGKPYVGRILADGSGPDDTFGVGVADNANNGFVILNTGFGGAAESVSITSGGSIGIGGWVKNSTDDNNSTPALWKF